MQLPCPAKEEKMQNLKGKLKTNQTNTQRKGEDSHRGICGVPYWVTVYPSVHSSSLLWVIGLVWGLCLLPYPLMGSHSGSSWISCCYPMLRRFCCFGSIGLSLSHAPTVHRCGECWGGPSHSPGSGPGQLQGWSTHWRGELSKYLVTALPSRTQKLYFSVNHEIVLYSSHCFKYCILFIIFKE